MNLDATKTTDAETTDIAQITDTVQTADTAQRLRDKLIDDLVSRQQVQNLQVEAAMRAVPRHIFVPEASIDEAYADQVVITKRDEKGKAISSASAPWIVGLMLDWLDVRPGHRVLEIGAGTGYNAALLAHLVGESGSVTTVDVDQDTADRARAALVGSGYAQVNVVCGDGELGFLADAPYDRIIVTVGVADFPRAWWDQLTTDGRLVVPLRVRGSQRVIAFDRRDTCWQSTAIEFGGFMPIRGMGAQSLGSVVLYKTAEADVETHDVTLEVDEGQVVDRKALSRAFEYPKIEVETGVRLSNVGTRDEESSEWLQLWLTYSMSGYSYIGATDEAIASGLIKLPYRFHYNPAVFEKGSFAYLTLQPTVEPTLEAQGRHQFVICAHGPDAAGLAERVAEQVRIWDRDYRNVRPCIEAHYSDSSAQLENRFVIEKKHVRLVASWS